MSAPLSPAGDPAEEGSGRPGPTLLADLITLAKPGITLFCLLMTAGGWALAPENPGIRVFLLTLIGTAISVASANTLNMFLEREGDKAMARTRRRPLPAGRMKPLTALLLGIAGAVISTVLLVVSVNPLTAAVSTGALLLYVCVYTPMKRRSTQALAIGTIPGAAPPLVGWVAATGSLDAGGLVLFAILLVWQLPHFLAIALFRNRDYTEAGIRTVVAVRGDETARLQAFVYTLLLTPISLLLVLLGLAGWIYFVTASVLGAIFLVWSLVGFEAGSGVRWARQFFFFSLIYLPVLVFGLFLDRLLLR